LFCRSALCSGVSGSPDSRTGKAKARVAAVSCALTVAKSAALCCSSVTGLLCSGTIGAKTLKGALPLSARSSLTLVSNEVVASIAISFQL
jgi:hypothetical protein